MSDAAASSQLSLHTLDFYFDPISPYAYLGFERLPAALQGHSFTVNYRPVLFAGFLNQLGQKGPAEIEPKRQWTTRDTAYVAHRHGISLQWPRQHPFNPLPLLRLLIATAPAGGLPNRHACELVLRHVWQGGEDANAPARVEALKARLQPQRDPGGEDVKAELRQATEEALRRCCFGVPTIGIQHGGADRLFWGADALPMLTAMLEGDPWFTADRWTELGAPRAGLVRR